jgi:hypothetical protein
MACLSGVTLCADDLIGSEVLRKLEVDAMMRIDGVKSYASAPSSHFLHFYVYANMLAKIRYFLIRLENGWRVYHLVTT